MTTFGSISSRRSTLPRPGARFPRITFLRISVVASVVLFIASWAEVLGAGDSGFGDLFTGRAWRGITGFLGEMAGVGETEPPAFLRADRWLETAALAWQTLLMSVLAIGLAAGGVLLTILPAVRTTAFGPSALSRSPVWKAAFFLTRGIFITTRGIPELMWAMVLIFFFAPGIVPGALALAIHNYGILGKLCAEIVEDMDPAPVRALRAAGARGFQVVAYGVLPQVLPQFLTYTLYRWEVVIRTTVVVGFVSAGGLGREFRLHMSWFQYTDVALLLIWYLLLVLAVDLISAWMRRVAR